MLSTKVLEPFCNALLDVDSNPLDVSIPIRLIEPCGATRGSTPRLSLWRLSRHPEDRTTLVIYLQR